MGHLGMGTTGRDDERRGLSGGEYDESVSYWCMKRD
jgi:hypothetical protein